MIIDRNSEPIPGFFGWLKSINIGKLAIYKPADTNINDLESVCVHLANLGLITLLILF